MKNKSCILILAVMVALFLTACGGETAAGTAEPIEQQEHDAVPDSAASATERTATGTMLLDGKENAVYLEVSDTEIGFWDSASGGKLLAAAKYPEALAGAAGALETCDYTDLDGDGNSELTAEFLFADGSKASLVWFYSDGGLVYNGEFSRLPGEAAAGAD